MIVIHQHPLATIEKDVISLAAITEVLANDILVSTEPVAVCY